jgi:hypothetical protein
MALAQLKVVEPVSLLVEVQHHVEKLLETLREALLEARDATDVAWLRARSIRVLNAIYADIPVLRDEFVLTKLNALEAIERESIVGYAQAVSRSNKWRKALCSRYFGS